MEELASQSVLDSLVPHDAVEELSPVCVLHDQIQFPLGLNNLVELNDVGVPDFLEDLDFPRYTVDICLILNFGLLQDLDGDLLARDGLHTQLDLAKSSFAQSFLDHEV